MGSAAQLALAPEWKRLEESRDRKAHWKRWGPYLSERQWGTVREDYSEFGTAWDYFPHDQARSRAYRWGEDGLGGISDRHQKICFGIALWNGRDAILKERLFGLTGSEGNHGEDVKEYYFYLDSTPTHSYMKFLYKYPQKAFPYARLVEENRRRGKQETEFELLDSGLFEEDRYFDVVIEYAKATPEDILIRITAYNRGPEAAHLELLPTLWFRNTWSWDPSAKRPMLLKEADGRGAAVIRAEESMYGKRWLLCEGTPELLFTENETNLQRLFGVANRTPYVKDGINNYVVHGEDSVPLRRRPQWKIPSGPDSTSFLRSELPRLTNFIRSVCRKAFPKTRNPSNVRPLQECFGQSSSITMTSTPGSKAIRPGRLPRRAGETVATKNGRTSTTRTLFPCRTSGNIRGMRRGISRFIAFRSPRLIRILPKNSSR